MLGEPITPTKENMEKAREPFEWPGKEALHHIRTMYPGVWDVMGSSVKKSLKNHINNNFNLTLDTAIRQENEKCALEAKHYKSHAVELSPNHILHCYYEDIETAIRKRGEVR